MASPLTVPTAHGALLADAISQPASWESRGRNPHTRRIDRQWSAGMGLSLLSAITWLLWVRAGLPPYTCSKAPEHRRGRPVVRRSSLARVRTLAV
jgi:hypothetical protein